METTQTTTATKEPSRRRVNLLMFLVAGLVLVIDQITKRWIEANVSLGGDLPLVWPYVSLTNTQNTGAAFSILRDGNTFFIIVAFIVCSLIVYYAPRLPADDWLSRVGLGLQLGGAIGNLIDRLRQGYVTDFFHIRIPQIGFDWPVSNFADLCIVSGVFLLLLSSYLRERKDAKAQGAAKDTAEPAQDQAQT